MNEDELFYKLGNIEVVKLLMKAKNINPNKKNSDGDTALHVAYKLKRFDVMQLLAQDERVDVNETNIRGETLFYLACEESNLFVAKLLMKVKGIDVNKGNGHETPLSAICAGVWYKEQAPKIVKLLIEDPRVDINQPSRHGYTPLYQLCYAGKIPLVKLLMKVNGIDVNKTDDEDGDTPLLVAYKTNRPDCIRVVNILMKDPRVEVNKAGKDGDTILHHFDAAHEGGYLYIYLDMPPEEVYFHFHHPCSQSERPSSRSALTISICPFLHAT
jgi:ankyrin repeat protein